MAIIATPLGKLLLFLYHLIGNYGFSIIVFTLIIKLILLPLTLNQLKQTKKVTELQPKIKELQNKYKNDKETLNIKIMELYKEHKVNPLGGCLPLLIQMPIIIGLFKVLREPVKYISNPEFLQAVNESFLWIPNLSQPDKLILPILAGLTTFFSMNSVNAGNAPNSTVKTMNYIFPALVFWWGLSFPAGLTLYWVVSNLFQMAQQYFMPGVRKSKEELD
jgi:YidC/Oxa1 family membrane protein insertase